MEVEAVMSRMSREFSLVLVGAGILTTGYFMWPEDTYEKRAVDRAAGRVGGRTHGGGGMLLFVHSGGGSYSTTGSRGASMGRTSGGFGARGAAISGGGGGGGGS